MGRRRRRARRGNEWRKGALGGAIRAGWRVAGLTALTMLALAVGGLILASPAGCSPHQGPTASTPSEAEAASVPREIRVLLLAGQRQVMVTASLPPVYFTSNDPTERLLNLPRNKPMAFTLTAEGWRVGNTSLGMGDLTLRPQGLGSVRVGDANQSRATDKPYRGEFRFVPLGVGGEFDVVDAVDVDDYLKSVVSKELYPSWQEETYKAQAVVARTYALYEKHVPRPARHWDVYPDTRSQVYGGVLAESDKSKRAVEETSGVVVAYGAKGDERLFKAYFSSCCGGITQSNADVFGEPFLQPFTPQNVGSLCGASTKYNWGPVVVNKEELRRRFNAWGASKGRAEATMKGIRAIEIEARNQQGRPIRYKVTDTDRKEYVLGAEELRWAVNYSGSEGTTLFSGFVENIVVESDRVRFIGGHGYGHGVGMCQWCAEARAKQGMRHEDIVIAAFPSARLVRAY